jgi:hypothetical protein
MSAEGVAAATVAEIDAYRAPLVVGAPLGVPWSLERIDGELALARSALAPPDLKRLEQNVPRRDARIVALEHHCLCAPSR